MKEKHISQQEIIDLALEVGKVSSQLHIENCDVCRKRFTDYSKAFGASDNSKTQPSELLEARIKRSVRESVLEKNINNKSFLLKIAAGIIIIATAFILWVELPQSKDIQLIVESVKGETIIDGKNISQGYAKSGNTIETVEFASLVSFEKAFSVVLAPESRLRIIKLQKADNDKPLYAEFYLEKGELLARFGHDGIKVDYSFGTRSANIKSIGTEFLLKSGNDTTELSMIAGRVNFISAKDGESTETVQGMTYRTGRVSVIENNSSSIIKRINILSGYRANNQRNTDTENKKTYLKDKISDVKNKDVGNNDLKDNIQSKKNIDKAKIKERAKELREDAIKRKIEEDRNRKRRLRNRDSK